MFSLQFRKRFSILLGLVLLLFIVIGVRLINLQIVQGKNYAQEAQQRLSKSVPVTAPRGEVFDRNGTPLLQNKMGFSIEIQKTDISLSERNEVLSRLIALAKEHGFLYAHSQPKEEEMSLSLYREKYEISAEKYDDTAAYELISVYCEMENRMFSSNNPFVFATDVDIHTISRIKESADEFPGTNIIVGSTREYTQGNLAAHLLGRVGMIYREEYQQLKDQGYGMNDVLGKDGIEKILESYLKGIDGTSSVEYNIEGRMVRVVDSSPAFSTNYATLTLDAALQKVAEESLEKNIQKTRAAGAWKADRAGADCNAGAVVALDVHTGEVLAMASYPSYDPRTFNEDYAELYKNPANPMLNRAISGAYEPGSTFKMVTAIAAMSEEVLQPDEVIPDLGIYTFYAPSFTPACHIWNSSRQTHGDDVTVSSALRESCNYFFYEVGRRVTIQKINEYAKKFGLGTSTGIELEGEANGILAGPEYREKIGSEWYPGDTLQAAIGQSDNMFTPLQLAAYVATLANGGTRYKPHLIRNITPYNQNSDAVTFAPEIVDTIPIKSDQLQVIVQGMREVVTDGTAKEAFAGSPVAAAGKTGTAEVPYGSANGIFVGFAPYDNPQIAVAVVLEHGAGTYVASVARDIMEAYLLKE